MRGRGLFGGGCQAQDVVGDHGKGELDVYQDYAEDEDGKGECCGKGCEDGEGEGKDEEEGYDYGVDWIEECHG